MSGETITLKLTKPITAHGEEVSELTLRQPTTKEVIEIGLPTLLIPSVDGESVGIELRQKVVARYISRLASIPMGAVESLSLGDHSAASAVVMSFFGQGAGETTSS